MTIENETQILVIFDEEFTEEPVAGVQVRVDGSDKATLSLIREMCQYLDHIDSGFSFLDNADGRPIAPWAESSTYAAKFLPRVTIRHNNGASSAHRRRVSVPELTISDRLKQIGDANKLFRIHNGLGSSGTSPTSATPSVTVSTAAAVDLSSPFSALSSAPKAAAVAAAIPAIGVAQNAHTKNLLETRIAPSSPVFRKHRRALSPPFVHTSPRGHLLKYPSNLGPQLQSLPAPVPESHTLSPVVHRTPAPLTFIPADDLSNGFGVANNVVPCKPSLRTSRSLPAPPSKSLPPPPPSAHCGAQNNGHEFPPPVIHSQLSSPVPIASVPEGLPTADFPPAPVSLPPPLPLVPPPPPFVPPPRVQVPPPPVASVPPVVSMSPRAMTKRPSKPSVASSNIGGSSGGGNSISYSQRSAKGSMTPRCLPSFERQLERHNKLALRTAGFAPTSPPPSVTLASPGRRNVFSMGLGQYLRHKVSKKPSAHDFGAHKGVELVVMWRNGRDTNAVPLVIGSVRIPHANFFLSDIRQAILDFDSPKSFYFLDASKRAVPVKREKFVRCVDVGNGECVWIETEMRVPPMPRWPLDVVDHVTKKSLVTIHVNRKQDLTDVRQMIKSKLPNAPSSYVFLADKGISVPMCEEREQLAVGLCPRVYIVVLEEKLPTEEPERKRRMPPVFSRTLTPSTSSMNSKKRRNRSIPSGILTFSASSNEVLAKLRRENSTGGSKKGIGRFVDKCRTTFGAQKDTSPFEALSTTRYSSASSRGGGFLSHQQRMAAFGHRRSQLRQGSRSGRGSRQFSPSRVSSRVSNTHTRGATRHRRCSSSPFPRSGPATYGDKDFEGDVLGERPYDYDLEPQRYSDSAASSLNLNMFGPSLTMLRRGTSGGNGGGGNVSGMLARSSSSMSISINIAAASFHRRRKQTTLTRTRPRNLSDSSVAPAFMSRPSVSRSVGVQMRTPPSSGGHSSYLRATSHSPSRRRTNAKAKAKANAAKKSPSPPPPRSASRPRSLSDSYSSARRSSASLYFHGVERQRKAAAKRKSALDMPGRRGRSKNRSLTPQSTLNLMKQRSLSPSPSAAAAAATASPKKQQQQSMWSALTEITPAVRAAMFIPPFLEKSASASASSAYHGGIGIKRVKSAPSSRRGSTTAAVVCGGVESAENAHVKRVREKRRSDSAPRAGPIQKVLKVHTPPLPRSSSASIVRMDLSSSRTPSPRSSSRKLNDVFQSAPSTPLKPELKLDSYDLFRPPSFHAPSPPQPFQRHPPSPRANLKTPESSANACTVSNGSTKPSRAPEIRTSSHAPHLYQMPSSHSTIASTAFLSGSSIGSWASHGSSQLSTRSQATASAHHNPRVNTPPPPPHDEVSESIKISDPQGTQKLPQFPYGGNSSPAQLGSDSSTTAAAHANANGVTEAAAPPTEAAAPPTEAAASQTRQKRRSQTHPTPKVVLVHHRSTSEQSHLKQVPKTSRKAQALSKRRVDNSLSSQGPQGASIRSERGYAGLSSIATDSHWKTSRPQPTRTPVVSTSKRKSTKKLSIFTPPEVSSHNVTSGASSHMGPPDVPPPRVPNFAVCSPQNMHIPPPPPLKPPSPGGVSNTDVARKSDVKSGQRSTNFEAAHAAVIPPPPTSIPDAPSFQSTIQSPSNRALRKKESSISSPSPAVAPNASPSFSLSIVRKTPSPLPATNTIDHVAKSPSRRSRPLVLATRASQARNSAPPRPSLQLRSSHQNTRPPAEQPDETQFRDLVAKHLDANTNRIDVSESKQNEFAVWCTSVAWVRKADGARVFATRGESSRNAACSREDAFRRCVEWYLASSVSGR